MAGQIDQPGAVALMEEAAHLLRRAPLETLLCHWIGSIPFAILLLVFWTQWTHPPISDPALGGEAVALALALVWMNCWRTVFAGRLYRTLSGTPGCGWSRARVLRLAASQALLGATKLLVLPLSLIAVFPFAAVVAFYRNAAVLADGADPDPLASFGRARRLAARGLFHCWVLQFALLLLSLVTMLNLAISFIALPQLVKMLTGYESAFTRSGTEFFTNRLFLLFVMGATWLVFDPFVQAVYCVRCFLSESVETGEDVRAGLRRIRSAVARRSIAAVLAAVWLALGPAAPAQETITAGGLQRAVEQTMQAPEYNWRIPPPSEAQSQTPWIVRATDRAIVAVQSAVKWALHMIDRFLRWLFGGLGLSPMPAGGAAPARALHWSVWVLLGLAAALCLWVLWRSRLLRRTKSKHVAGAPVAAVRLDDENLSADRLPEAGWLEMADRCLAEGSFRLALRAFYLANLAWLGRHGFLTIDCGRTNREFESELRRRARQSPQARDLFSSNVLAFERAWYGSHEVVLGDAEAFRKRTDEIKSLLRPEAA